jgi:parallel beta-helix repeat protein
MRKLLLVALLALGGPITLAAAPVTTIGVTQDARGQRTIIVTGAGAEVTLASIKAGLGADGGLLEETSPGVWLLRANLLIGRGVALALRRAEVTELRLRSEPGPAVASLMSDEDRPAEAAGEGYDYSRFVYLRTDNGAISIDGVRVVAWNPAAGAADEEPHDGRAYILAKYDARLDISDAELGYLGFADGESYGVAWRDINDAGSAEIRRRVTGRVVNSRFHHNYYGVYTYQASAMVFRGNQFDHNVSYGFDPHDYSANFVVEDNVAFANGNHGFIISRGCTGFVFRRNRSYENNNPDPTRLAHGFMLDAGSPTSADPQASSSNNLLEDNVAYGNEGYGLRILGSDTNTARANRFEGNLQGVAVEMGSDGNTLEGNTISASQSHGVVLRGAARTVVRGNSIAGSGGHGVYLRDGASDSRVEQNRIAASGLNGIRASGADVVRNSWRENLITDSAAASIAVTSGANGGLRPPRITALGDGHVSGTALPGAWVELFGLVPAAEQAFGRAQAGPDGAFGAAVPDGVTAVMAVATDASGNSSGSVTYGQYRLFLPQIQRGGG